MFPKTSIVLTNNTTMGLHLALSGIEFEDGDEILTTLHEHLTLDSPLHVIKQRYCNNCGKKITINRLELPENTQADQDVIEAFIDAIGPKTKMVCFSHVNWTNGMRLPAKEICEVARKSGVKSLVDGAHSYGMIGIDLSEIRPDFYAASGHKWLNGPPGTGFIYFDSSYESQEKFYPILSQWEHVRPYTKRKPDPITLAESMQFRGQNDTPVFLGMVAALEAYLQIGTSAVEDRILSLSANLKQLIVERLGSAALLSPGIQANKSLQSGIVTFFPDSLGELTEKEIDDVVNQLRTVYQIWGRKVKFYRSLSDMSEHKMTYAIRFCTHYFNTESEIERAVEAIRELAGNNFS